MEEERKRNKEALASAAKVFPFVMCFFISGIKTPSSLMVIVNLLFIEYFIIKKSKVLFLIFPLKFRIHIIIKFMFCKIKI